MGLTDVIADFATGTYTVTRTTQSTYLDGRVIPGADSVFDIVASITPMSGRELQVHAEGNHASEAKMILTVTQIRPIDPTNAGDSIAINGEQWDFFKVSTWEAFGETFYQAYAARRVTP